MRRTASSLLSAEHPRERPVVSRQADLLLQYSRTSWFCGNLERGCSRTQTGPRHAGAQELGGEAGCHKGEPRGLRKEGTCRSPCSVHARPRALPLPPTETTTPQPPPEPACPSTGPSASQPLPPGPPALPSPVPLPTGCCVDTQGPELPRLGSPRSRHGDLGATVTVSLMGI